MDVNPIDVQKYLKGASYPTDGESLASLAEENGAPDKVVDELRSMGSSQMDGPDQVMKKIAQS